MSGGGIEDVLREHTQNVYASECECCSGSIERENSCDCGWSGGPRETFASHLAAAVVAWLDARLADEDILEAVGEAIALASGEVTINGEPDAALSAVRGVLGGEGS